MVEGPLELLEYSGILNQGSLHLWSDLRIEFKLFDNEVEIMHKGLFYVFSNVVVKRRLDVEGSVGLLNLLDPHIQRIKLLLNQIIEVVRCVENTIYRTHQEREEGETEEL